MQHKGRFARALAVAFGLAAMAPSVAEAGQSKVTLCHKGRLISVGPLAAAYHILIHGDTVDTCSDDPGGGSGGGAGDPGSGTGA